MAQKKNDIIEEQRRARAEFLKLKKMQNGEINAGPKPSEVAIVPTTPKEKWDNFWFQYKWGVIAIVASVIVLAIMITQCASRKNPDIEVVYFTYKPVLDEQITELSDYLTDYLKEIRAKEGKEDSEIFVRVINCSFENSNKNIRYKTDVLSKLQAIITANEKALLFITDAESIKYFENINTEEEIFEGEPIILGEEFYKGTESKDLGPLPEGLTLSIRRVSKTFIEKRDGVKEAYSDSKKILEAIAKNQSQSALK